MIMIIVMAMTEIPAIVIAIPLVIPVAVVPIIGVAIGITRLREIATGIRAILVIFVPVLIQLLPVLGQFSLHSGYPAAIALLLLFAQMVEVAIDLSLVAGQLALILV